MIKLEKIWIELARREKDTLQIGRTHGQHAQAITFGFAVAGYVERWGGRILQVKKTSEALPGKFSGAVGSYNASALLFDDPERFEQALLEELEISASPISTQITPREPIVDFFHAIISSFGVLANFSDDMRHLQRTEIAEVEEPYGEKEQVGSSTMPHKRNPINFENIKSMWKTFMPRIITLYLDQISEHQRDLTNSCSMRYLPELLVVFTSSVRRTTKVVSKLRVNRERMGRNFELEKDKILAEPLYILLSIAGHTDAHEFVRKLVLDSLHSKKSLQKMIEEDESLIPYIKKLNKYQREILEEPSKYIGVAAKKVEEVTKAWEERLKELT
jgi:adenylosuccinate lyase